MVLWTILSLLAVLVSLIAVVLITPMNFRLVAAAGETADFRAEFRTFWGLGPKLTLKAGEDGVWTARERQRPEKKSKARRDKQRPFDVEQVSHLVLAVPDAVLRSLGRIRILKFRLQAVFGFEDPAETGEVFGRLTSLIYGLPGERCEVEICPDFDGAGLQGSAEVLLRFTPLLLIWPIIQLLLMFRKARS